jgi:ABC-type transport system involved in multi-copper enzyme maturation permease subunit
LTTPLTARTIVLGKWWGAFRIVPWIALLPTLSAIVLAFGAPAQPFVPPGFAPRVFDLSPWERLAAPVVVLSQILLYGAAFVSLALFLATRFTRQTRVLFLTLGAYGIVTIVVPIVAEGALLHSNRSLAEGLGAMSPIGGPILTLAPMFNLSYSPLREVFLYQLGWLLIASVTACILMHATISSFDRWMGRMSDRRSGKPPSTRFGQDRALPDSLVPGARRDWISDV